jgi:predicted nuclease of restriction endonuclease-like (RecB) superfamily
MFVPNKDYKKWFLGIKAKIQSAQLKAAVSVNIEMLKLYWDLGKDIVEKQEFAKWGDGVVRQLEIDLKLEFSNVRGFSRRNLLDMRRWYLFYKEESEIVRQLVAQIPWGHNLVILNKIKEVDRAQYYISKTIEHGWSRDVLVHQIEARLYENLGKSVTNFELRLPKSQSDLAIQTLKNKYSLSFIGADEVRKEKKLQDRLVSNITNFLLELGKGFAYMGKEYKLEVGGDEFYIDLLFYHTILRCYVVIEIKSKKFKPEFLGQLNFYITAVDRQIKLKQDNPTIGLLLCKEKNDLVVEYSLSEVCKPIGVSEYQLKSNSKIRDLLPSKEELERVGNL